MAYLAHPIETLESGSTATRNMLEVARRDGARFLLTSTSECYGDPLEHPQVETYWGNVNPVGMRSCYDESKRYAEAMTMAYHRTYGVRTNIARIFNTYGPRMALNDGRVVPAFIDQASRGVAMTIFGDGSQTRSFCYVADLVDGLVRLESVGRAVSGEFGESGGADDSGVCGADQEADGSERRDCRSSLCHRTIRRRGGRIFRKRKGCWGGSRRSSWRKGCGRRWRILRGCRLEAQEVVRLHVSLSENGAKSAFGEVAVMVGDRQVSSGRWVAPNFVASRSLAVESKTGEFQLSNDFAVSEAGETAHSGGYDDGEIRLALGGREVFRLIVLTASFNQFSSDVAGDFESFRNRAPLGDEALEFLGRRQIHAFGQFFNLNRDG